VIDVRTALQFDEAHIPGAVSNTILHSGFGTRLAWIASPDDEIVLVGRDDADALHAAELAAAVGLATIAGYLAGGMTSWREERLRTERIERLTVPELHGRARELQILDVRERDEWDAGHIPNTHFMPYHDIRAVPEGLDPERPVAVICASGQRAVVGASLLQRHGARRVLHVVDGGVPTWVRNGWPVVR
jgi:rhodanese-related sulfurtransferase